MSQLQKIKAEIERLKKIVDDPILSDNDLIIGERNTYTRILSFIDSMQEEVSPIWHDVSEEPDEQRELLCEWDSVDATWHEVAFYHADTQDYWNYTSKVEGVTKWAYIDDLLSIKEEEPVSEYLEEEVSRYIEQHKSELNGYFDIRRIARHFANWQKEQFEKERLAHCDNITFEQFKLEQEFVDSHLEKNNRIPTLLDAIEYGMKSKNEQMIQKAVEWVEENIDEYGAISSMGKDLRNYLEDNT